MNELSDNSLELMLIMLSLVVLARSSLFVSICLSTKKFMTSINIRIDNELIKDRKSRSEKLPGLENISH